MSNKKIRIVLTPKEGVLKMLASWVDGVLAIKTSGARAQASVRAQKTAVRVKAAGDPHATLHCLVQAEYASGNSVVVVDDVLRLDAMGQHDSTHAVPTTDPGTAPLVSSI